jgi:hypothetical protein
MQIRTHVSCEKFYTGLVENEVVMFNVIPRFEKSHSGQCVLIKLPGSEYFLFYFIIFTFTYMCIYYLGHFSPSPPPGRMIYF